VDLLRQAVVIMCLGMGLTFVFLYVVILAIRLSGRLVAMYEARAALDDGKDGAIVAAIAAAVNEHDSGRPAGG
jgi:Na+-transporting methylmalonyl-CoA/oxaloacetate decarboxylase gamma subunit